GPLDHRSRESLRSLRPPETVSWYGFRDTLLLDVFDGIGKRGRGHGAHPRARLVEHAVDGIARHEGARAVVDEDDGDELGQGAQSRTHRLRAGRAARHERQTLAHELGEPIRGPRLETRRQG